MEIYQKLPEGIMRYFDRVRRCRQNHVGQTFTYHTPRWSLFEALKRQKIHGVAGKLPENSSLVSRLFRSPSYHQRWALVGGGGIPQPGEISLAHIMACCFLMSYLNLKRTVLEVMRQPMEERRYHFPRKGGDRFPANFMLIASANPCPLRFL